MSTITVDRSTGTHRPTRRRARGAAAVVALGAAASLLAGPAQASPSQGADARAGSHGSLAPGSEYVALGSSYAAGGGLLPADPADTDGACGRSLAAYPHLVAEALDLRLVDAACGGSTNANVTTTPQTVRTASGTTTVAPQIGAVGPKTKLVTLTVGGNDVSYIGNLMAESCLADLATNPSSRLGNQLASYGICTPVSDRAVAGAFRTLEPSIESTIRAVKVKAPHARVLVVEYPEVIPGDAQPCTVLPIAHDRLEHYRAVAAGLRVATELAAVRTGAELVPVAWSSRGHDACSSDPWITGYASGVMNIMHPNAAGHAAVADAVVRELRKPLAVGR